LGKLKPRNTLGRETEVSDTKQEQFQFKASHTYESSNKNMFIISYFPLVPSMSYSRDSVIRNSQCIRNHLIVHIPTDCVAVNSSLEVSWDS
jgi:hypothetical protein